MAVWLVDHVLTPPRRQPRRGCSFLAGRAVRSSDVRARDSSSPRTPSSASPRRRGCESTSARESAPRTSLRCTHRRPRAAIGVAAARALRAPLSADPPRPARSARGTARGSGTAHDPDRVGRRHRTVAPTTRPGHHRAARRCRRARPEAPHGPGRRSTPRGGAARHEARYSGPASSAISTKLIDENACATSSRICKSLSRPGLVGLLLVSCIETKARLVEQRDRDYSLVLDLTGFILGFIPGLLVLFLVLVRPYPLGRVGMSW